MIEGLWETPLGNIKIDNELALKISKKHDFFIETPVRFEDDNTVELQLPFVKYFFPDSLLVPIGAPPIQKSLELAKKIAHLCIEMGRSVVVIGSTDLTHYGPKYGFMPAGTGDSALKWSRQNDEKIIEKMVKMDSQETIKEGLRNHNACCPGAIASATCMLKELGAKEGEVLMYATSYDKSPASSFVGYVGIVY